MMKSKIPVCSDVGEMSRLITERRRSQGAMEIKSMYNSYVDRILVGSECGLYTLPIDDHLIVRGHAVFDTATIVNGALYRHRVHIDRFFESATKAGLDFSFLTNCVDVEKQKERLVEIEEQLAAVAGIRDGELRLWLSAGPGNLGVTAAGCKTTLYIICFGEDWPKLFSQKLRGISEFTVSPKYPVKNKVLATMKSTNYLINALGATESTGKGGGFGIWVDPVTDKVYESSVCNVVFVLQDGSMVTPPFIDGDILKGCTVRRIVELARKHLLGNLLQKVVTDEEVYRGKLLEVGIKEMFLTSGDLFVDPITRWDDLVLQEDATPGPVVTKLVEILYKEAVRGDTEYHQKIKYDSVSKEVKHKICYFPEK